MLLNRIIVRGRLDPVAQRLNIEQAEASGKGVGLAMSGNLDFSTSDPRLAIGMATRNISRRRVQAAVAALHQSAGAHNG